MDKIEHPALKRLLNSRGEKTLSDGEKCSHPEDYRKVVIKRVYLLYQFLHRLIHRQLTLREVERRTDRSIKLEGNGGGGFVPAASCPTRETAISRPPAGFHFFFSMHAG